MHLFEFEDVILTFKVVLYLNRSVSPWSSSAFAERDTALPLSPGHRWVEPIRLGRTAAVVTGL